MATVKEAEARTADLVITRRFDAPVECVWKAWTDPDDIKQWWGPDGFSAPLARIDFREGGTSLVCMSSPQFGDQYSTWRYTTIVPFQRIEFIHNLADQNGVKIDPTSVGMPSDFPQDLRNAVVFTRIGDNATEVTVTEFGWRVGQMRELSRMGMEQCLAKMSALFADGRL